MMKKMIVKDNNWHMCIIQNRLNIFDDIALLF